MVILEPTSDGHEQGIRFTDAFKQDRAAQVVERGVAVDEVAEQVGIPTKSRLISAAQCAQSPLVSSEIADPAVEIRRLKRELAGITVKRTIVKRGATLVRHWSEANGRPRPLYKTLVAYTFIEAHRAACSVRSMCRMLMGHISCLHTWMKEPLNALALENARQTERIRQGRSAKV